MRTSVCATAGRPKRVVGFEAHARVDLHAENFRRYARAGTFGRRSDPCPASIPCSNPTWSRCSNAVDQTAKEIGTRFDFKGSSARVELKDKELTLCADSELPDRPGDRHPDRQAHQAQRRRRASSTAAPKIEKIGGDKVKQAARRQERHRQRDAQEDADARQAEQAEGAGRDPGRHGARHRRQARRPAGGDGADPQGVADAAALASTTSGTERCST